MMRMLELFSGSGVMGETFRSAGWDVVTVDLHTPATIKFNLLDVTREDIISWCGGEPDFIWMSPPCTCFSIAKGGRLKFDWKRELGTITPRSDDAILGYKLMLKSLQVTRWFHNALWVIENPRGLMRKMPCFKGITRYTVTYCQYGHKAMKPTDLWTNMSWNPRRPCSYGSPCHESAGSNRGIKGMNKSYERAKIPTELCIEVEQAARSSLSGKKANSEQVKK
jgi:hypothetical protein